MKATKIMLLVGIFALALAVPGFAATNLLTNGSFEDGPTYGEFTGTFAPTGWTQGPENTTETHNWNGVFDSTWKNHNCNYPAIPDPLHQAKDGNYFLGKWLAPQAGCETHAGTGGGEGYIYQTVNGLAPGTYYFSAWAATYHSMGWGLARIVALPQAYDGSAYTPALHPIYPINTPFMDASPVPTYASTGRAAAPAETEVTTWPFTRAGWANCGLTWKKLSCEVTLAAGQNACTVFLSQQTSSNDTGAPQFIQIDAARFAATQLLEIKNVQITSMNQTSATIEWDIYDGDNPVQAATTRVKYGKTAAFGSVQSGSEPDPNPCNDLVVGRPGHYVATLSGLTANTTYYWCIEVDAGTYKSFGPWKCDLSNVPEYHRSYEAATYTPSPTTFKTLQAISITSVTATNITQNSATINWTTNVPATSQVNYGLFGTIDQVKSDSNLVTSHSVTITGLSSTASYSYNVTSTATGYNDKTSSTYKFNTLPGPQIMNGDFELRASTDAKALYWNDVPSHGGLTDRLSGVFSIPSHGGSWYYGRITNSSAPDPLGYATYQQIATNPGDIISVYAWSLATAQGSGGGGAPHRFGENNNRIGVDPTGEVMGPFSQWPMPNIAWSSDICSIDWRTFANNVNGWTGSYRKIGICAVAKSTAATVYLHIHDYWGNAWLFNAIDDVTVAPPTAIQSVGALKALPMQTNVNLTEGDYVVTYVQAMNPDMDENNGQPYFYIQDRTKGGAGIKVTAASSDAWPNWVATGQKVNIVGTLDWGTFKNYRFGNLDQQFRLAKPAGEPVLRACKVTDTGQTASLPEPVGVTNISLGGSSSADTYYTNAGVAGGTGANNVGMRVRTWGKIVKIAYDANYWVYMIIDDGSKVPAPLTPGFTVTGVQTDNGLVNGTMVKTSKIYDLLSDPSDPTTAMPGLYVTTWSGDWPKNDDGSDVQVGDYVILTGISGVRVDLDTDDHQCVAPGSTDPNNLNLVPEAEKNVRFIKLDQDQYGLITGAKYIKLQ